MALRYAILPLEMHALRLGSATLRLVEGDLTLQDADAIVNAANSLLKGGGGVDGAIHRAGGASLARACKEWTAQHGPLPPGKAMITPGGSLKARFVIHAVGPIYDGGPSNAETLAGAYRECLRIAEEKGLKTLAFPSISTGAYGYPLKEAAPVALKAISAHLMGESRLSEVRMVLFDDKALAAYRKALDTLR